MNRVDRLVWLAVIIAFVLIFTSNIPIATSTNLAMIDLIQAVASSEDNMFAITMEENPAITDALSTAYQHNPQNPLYAYHLAQLSFWSGDLDSTINLLEANQGKKLAPLPEFLLGYSLWQLGDSSQASQVWGQITNSEKLFEQWASVAEAEKANKMMELGYTQLLAMDSDNASARAGFWFAHCNILMGRESSFAEIEDCIHQAFKYNAEDYPRLLNLGKVLVENKHYELASPILEQAIILDGGKSHWASYYLGLAYYYQKEYELAENALRHVIQIAPNFGRGYHWLARTMVRMGRHNEASDYYAKAVDLLPDDAPLLKEYQNLKKLEN